MVEKRKHTRMDLDDLAARLFRENGDIEVEYFPINVSPDGVAIFTSLCLPVGEILKLELEVKTVELVVRWCRPKENDPAIFRVGLELVENSDRLDELIQSQLDC